MSTTRRRRSYEAGHKPKWLVVIDDTEECDRAVYFAARRAARVGAGVIMLRVIETHDRNQQWAGVADIMKAEAHEEANAALDKYATRANGIAEILAPGLHGSVVEQPTDLSGLMNALRFWMEPGRREDSRSAREAHARDFAIARNVGRTLQILLQFAEASAPSTSGKMRKT